MTKKQLLRKLILKELKALTEAEAGIVWRQGDRSGNMSADNLVASLVREINKTNPAKDLEIKVGNAFKPWISIDRLRRVVFQKANPEASAKFFTGIGNPLDAADIIYDLGIETALKIFNVMDPKKSGPMLMAVAENFMIIITKMDYNIVVKIINNMDESNTANVMESLLEEEETKALALKILGDVELRRSVTYLTGMEPTPSSKILAAMEVGKSAPIINAMEFDKSVPIINAMEVEKSAPFLTAMEFDKSAKILIKIGGENEIELLNKILSDNQKKLFKILLKMKEINLDHLNDLAKAEPPLGEIAKEIATGKEPDIDKDAEQKEVAISKAMIMIMSRNADKSLISLGKASKFIQRNIAKLPNDADDKKEKLENLKKEASFLFKKIKIYTDFVEKFYGADVKVKNTPMADLGIYKPISKIFIGALTGKDNAFKNITPNVRVKFKRLLATSDFPVEFPEKQESLEKIYGGEIQQVITVIDNLQASEDIEQEQIREAMQVLKDYRQTFKEDVESYEKRVDQVIAIVFGKEPEPEQETEVSERAIRDTTLNVVKSKLQPFAKNLLSEPSIFQTDELGKLDDTSALNKELENSFQELQKIHAPPNDITQTAQSFYPFLQAASTNKLTKKKIYELVEKIKEFETGENDPTLQKNTGEAIKKIVKAIKGASEKKNEILKDKSNVYLKFTSIATPLVEFFDVGVPLFKVVKGDLGAEDEFKIHPVYADGLNDEKDPFTPENKEYIQILKRKNAEEIKEKFKPMDKDRLNQILETLELITEKRNKEMKRDIENLETNAAVLAGFAGSSKIKNMIKEFNQRYGLLEGKPRNYNSSDYKKILNKFKEIFDASKGTSINPKTFTDNNRGLPESRIRELIKPYLKQKLKNKRRIS